MQFLQENIYLEFLRFCRLVTDFYMPVAILKTKIIMNFIYKFSSYRAENKLFGFKNHLN